MVKAIHLLPSLQASIQLGILNVKGLAGGGRGGGREEKSLYACVRRGVPPPPNIILTFSLDVCVLKRLHKS